MYRSMFPLSSFRRPTDLLARFDGMVTGVKVGAVAVPPNDPVRVALPVLADVPSEYHTLTVYGAELPSGTSGVPFRFRTLPVEEIIPTLVMVIYLVSILFFV